MRLHAITGLRWWAAFGVFLYHMQNFSALPYMNPVVSQGYFGVTFFFVLSGFVLAWSHKPGVDRATFWWRRFARIYPLHFVTLIFAIPVFYSFSPDPAQSWVKEVSIGILLLSFLLVQGWSRDSEILFSGNPAAWTLTSEAFFYFLFPFTNKIFLRFSIQRALWATAGIFLALLLMRVVLLVYPDLFLSSLPWPILRLPEFIIGIGLAVAIKMGWKFPIPLWLSYLLAICGILGVISLNRFSEGIVFGEYLQAFSSEIVIAVCALLIISTAQHELSGGRTVHAHRILVKLGEWSFAFYLVHATLIYIFLSIFGRQQDSFINIFWHILLLGLSIGLSAVLNQFLEKPLEKKMRAWRDRQRKHGDEQVEVGLSEIPSSTELER